MRSPVPTQVGTVSNEGWGARVQWKCAFGCQCIVGLSCADGAGTTWNMHSVLKTLKGTMTGSVTYDGHEWTRISGNGQLDVKGFGVSGTAQLGYKGAPWGTLSVDGNLSPKIWPSGKLSIIAAPNSGGEAPIEVGTSWDIALHHFSIKAGAVLHLAQLVNFNASTDVGCSQSSAANGACNLDLTLG